MVHVANWGQHGTGFLIRQVRQAATLLDDNAGLDAFLCLAETQALHPLHFPAEGEQTPATDPWGF